MGKKQGAVNGGKIRGDPEKNHTDPATLGKYDHPGKTKQRIRRK